MLQFPKCDTKIPTHLSPFNPKHYALLAYWIYFHPTILKCYFHQALPDLYDPAVEPGFFRRWGNPAYRNLYFMVPTIALLISLALSAPVTLLSSWTLDVPVDWATWRDGVMFGVALGVTLGMAFGMVGRVLGSSALGSLMGVIFGVTIGVVGGMTVSVALSVKFANLTDAAIIVSAVFGIIAGMAITLDVEIGVAVSLTFLTIGAMSFGAEFIVYKLFGVRFGALLARGVMSGAFVAGAFRVVLYPFQFGLALLSFLPGVRHPLDWDELMLLPLPWTRSLLYQRLRRDEARGLHLLAAVWRNLFCRPALQSVLYRYLHKHPSPLRFLYHVLTEQAFETYMLIPMTPQQWENNVSVRRILLGELALQHVEATHNPRFHRSSWWLNLHIYRRPHTPLTRFAKMLYTLSDEKTFKSEHFDLLAYAEIYTKLENYPDGKEICLSFDAMAAFLSYRELSTLAEAENIASQLSVSLSVGNAIRHATLLTLIRLGRVGADIAFYLGAATSTEKLTALARATGELNELQGSVDRDLIIPERFLIQCILQQWQYLIMTEIGELGRVGEEQELSPAGC